MSTTPLQPGTDFGPFRIVSHLGSGGMGDVYSARDTRLERDVAVKVLPREYAEDAERQRRFEQEARAVAQLSHPNILAVHDVGTFDGAPYLVSELLEGETLRTALRDGPLPHRQTTECAAQIARGLAAAHQKGIIHRDLKPENLFLTRDGHLKILDFGLAKLIHHDELEHQETLLDDGLPSTEAGRLLGTMGYMAPEQVRGRPADHRSDIFACGVILYEMATGRSAFARDSAADTMSAILHEDPPEPAATERPIPPALDRVIRHCLEKRPEARFQSASDLAFDLETLSRVSLAGGVASERMDDLGRWRLALPWALAAVLGIAALLAAVRPLSVTPTGGEKLVRFVAEVTTPTALGPRTTLALSPDGQSLVFSRRQGDDVRLFLRRLDDLVAAPIVGTEGGNRPFFSADGAWLGFFSKETLWKVPLAGGPPVKMCRAPDPFGIGWGADGTLVFNPVFGEPLLILRPGEDEPRQLTTLQPDRKEGAHLWPQVLPDGKNAIFTVWTKGSWDEARIEAVNLATGERKLLITGGTDARYTASGHLLFARGNTILAVSIDPESLEIAGEPLPVLEGVNLVSSNGSATFSVADDGTLAYLPAQPAVDREMVWVDRQGGARLALADRQAFMRPRLAPDGRRVATHVEGSTFHVWIHDLESGTRTRLTPEVDSGSPLWTPDGERVVFFANPDGRYHLYSKRSDGSGGLEKLAATAGLPMAAAFSPDRRWLLYLEEDHPETDDDLWLLDLAGEPRRIPFRQTPASEEALDISPDGKFVAFCSNETGRTEIFVTPFPGPGASWQISTEGGREPRWNPAGGELFFRQTDKMMRVAIDSGPPFRAGRPEVLFEGAYVQDPYGHGSYDVTPDGKRFLMLRHATHETRVDRMVVVLNWFEELRRRVPRRGAP